MKKFSIVILFFIIALPLKAQIHVPFLELKTDNTHYVLNAHLKINWNERLKETLHYGIPLFFVADAQITQKRFYIWNTQIAHAQKKWQISFHPITREYRLHYGGLYQSFVHFENLEQALSNIKNWKISPKNDFNFDENTTLSFRFYLDTSALPQTFQIGIWGNKEWLLDSGWIFQKNLALTVENLPRAQNNLENKMEQTQ